MNRMPPRIVRRLMLAPIAVALSLAFVAISPLLLFVAFIADLFLPGNWRTVRVTAFVVAYAALEAIGLVAMFVLWVASGAGFALKRPRMLRAHYAFMRWWLGVVNRVARSLFHLRVLIEDPPVPRAGPILVFCRHAGPGNSMLLIGTILIGYRRFPRIVMLEKLQWEPLADLMFNRLPNRFIRHDPSARERQLHAIGELSSDLGDMDAFVLFPEGKDFTPRVKMRAIEYLRSKGLRGAAERAERMKHVLPPRHGGVLAAITAAPEADVVLVAHAVLEDVGTFKQLWSRVPHEFPIVARYWRIPPHEVPRDEDALIGWLYDWWERIDAWIVEHEIAARGVKSAAESR